MNLYGVRQHKFHKNLKSKIILLILLLVACGILYADYQIKEVHASETEVYRQAIALGNDSFEMGVWNSTEIADVEGDITIDLWKHHDIGYLFLPTHWKDGNVRWVFNCEGSVQIDGITVQSGDAFQAEPGRHTVITEEGEEYTIEVMYSGEVATLFLETDSGDLSELHQSKEIEFDGTYILFDKNGEYHAAGEIESWSCRGNASFTEYPKKSYLLELENETDLLGFGVAEDWLLLANYYDETLLRNMIAGEMGKQAKLSYTPDMNYADVYVNGEYIGNYLLSEQIEVEENRVDIYNLEEETEHLNEDLDLDDLTGITGESNTVFSIKWCPIDIEPENVEGGYLMELETDVRYEEEPSGFVSLRDQQVVLKSPEYASYNQVNYMANLYQEFEDAIYSETGFHPNTGKHYSEYADMDSFVKHYLIDEITKQIDASKTSFYMYKPLDSDKIYAGPLWDYDKSMSCEYEVEGMDLSDPNGLFAAVNKYQSDVWYALYQQEDFYKEVQNTYRKELRGITEIIADEWIMQTLEEMEDSAIMNLVRWDLCESGSDVETLREYYNQEVEELRLFLKNRLSFLDKEWEMATNE